VKIKENIVRDRLLYDVDSLTGIKAVFLRQCTENSASDIKIFGKKMLLGKQKKFASITGIH
jgi:hypothetical protein